MINNFSLCVGKPFQDHVLHPEGHAYRCNLPFTGRLSSDDVPLLWRCHNNLRLRYLCFCQLHITGKLADTDGKPPEPFGELPHDLRS